MNQALTTITIILSIAGFIPYIKDVIKGKTKPHIYSWFVWSILNIITAALQFNFGGGFISIITLIVGIICSVIMIYGLKSGIRNITKLDGIFLALAGFSLTLWLVIDQPLWSSILISLTSILGLLPTIRKSWINPFEETMPTYLIWIVRYILTAYILESFSLITIIPPLSGAISLTIFCCILVFRRMQIR